MPEHLHKTVTQWPLVCQCVRPLAFQCGHCKLRCSTLARAKSISMLPLAVCMCSHLTCNRAWRNGGGRPPRRAAGRKRRPGAWSGVGHQATTMHWISVLSSVAHVTFCFLQRASDAWPSDELMCYSKACSVQTARKVCSRLAVASPVHRGRIPVYPPFQPTQLGSLCSSAPVCSTPVC